MKKKIFVKALSLNKETVTNLEGQGMNAVRGGLSASCYETCGIKCNTANYTCDYCPPYTEYLTCRPCIA